MEFFGFFAISILLVTASAEEKRYRSDYVYNKATDAFYKLHIETMRTWRAKEVCIVEGGQLMVPKSQQDIVMFHTLFKRYPDLGNYAWVANDGQHHESAEETPIIDLEPVSGDVELQGGECDVLTRDGEVDSYECYHDLPFICKIESRDAVRDPRCDVYGRGYQYYPDVGSCYKIPRYVYSWNQAFEECKAEGAHLVIINSEAEHEVVWNVTKTSEAVNGATTSWFFFAGLRATRSKNGEPRQFLTIFNQSLDDAGYSQWSENEPNNYQDTEYCGSIFKNDGKYNDLNCEHLYGFICEKEVHI